MGYPLRILHVVVNMNRGGAETLIMNLYRNMDRTKVQFDFLTCKEGVFDKEIVDMGGKVHRIPYITDVGHFGFTKALHQFFASHPEYKVVHSHLDKMSGVVLRLAQKAGIPIRIAHSHNTSSEGGMAAKVYKWFSGKAILSSATHLIACSNAAAKWLFANQANTALILKNGIECDKFVFSPEIRKQVREELKLTQDSFVVGHVGRFAYQKNHSFLIDTFAQFMKYRQDAVLILVGDGPLRSEIEKKVENLNVRDNVKFLGVRSDIERILQALDIFVFPSLHEGLPVTLIEAQGAGLPCVISDAITEEVDMGMELVQFISLNNRTTWIEEIKDLGGRNPVRDTSLQSLTKRGYNISDTARTTQDFYLAISR